MMKREEESARTQKAFFICLDAVRTREEEVRDALSLQPRQDNEMKLRASEEVDPEVRSIVGIRRERESNAQC